MTDTETTYRGRFAPSPTGPLHLGSLYTAVASFLQARRQQGQWLVRIDDIDTPRCVPGAADRILRTLERFGLHWDADIRYQSRELESYHQAIQTLKDQRRLYPCVCTRKSLEGSAPIYPGRCRSRRLEPCKDHALRVEVHHHPIEFQDRIRGLYRQNLASACGDFIVRRRDGIYAYQLAVVVDDHQAGVTEVLRGADLLDNTPRQIHLQRLLGYSSPDYAHIPILVDSRGNKLSKQTRASPVDATEPGPVLHNLLELLGQAPPKEIEGAPAEEILTWAINHWSIEKIPPAQQIVIMPEIL